MLHELQPNQIPVIVKFCGRFSKKVRSSCAGQEQLNPLETNQNDKAKCSYYRGVLYYRGKECINFFLAFWGPKNLL